MNFARKLIAIVITWSLLPDAAVWSAPLLRLPSAVVPIAHAGSESASFLSEAFELAKIASPLNPLVSEEQVCEVKAAGGDRLLHRRELLAAGAGAGLFAWMMPARLFGQTESQLEEDARNALSRALEKPQARQLQASLRPLAVPRAQRGIEVLGTMASLPGGPLWSRRAIDKLLLKLAAAAQGKPVEAILKGAASKIVSQDHLVDLFLGADPFALETLRLYVPVAFSMTLPGLKPGSPEAHIAFEQSLEVLQQVFQTTRQKQAKPRGAIPSDPRERRQVIQRQLREITQEFQEAMKLPAIAQDAQVLARLQAFLDAPFTFQPILEARARRIVMDWNAPWMNKRPIQEWLRERFNVDPTAFRAALRYRMSLLNPKRYKEDVATRVLERSQQFLADVDSLPAEVVHEIRSGDPKLAQLLDEFRARMAPTQVPAIESQEHFLVSHRFVNEVIKKNLPSNLRNHPGNIKNYPMATKRFGVQARLIPIVGLYKEAGQFAHIGLGRVYGEPVIYIDADYAHHGLVQSHELYEITRWEELRQSLGLTPSEMRAWIRTHYAKAKDLAGRWHRTNPANINYLFRGKPVDEIVDPYAGEKDVNLAAGPEMKFPNSSIDMNRMPLEKLSYLDRYENHWAWLRTEALPAIVTQAKRQGKRRIHIVAMGASTGEELAAAFHEVVSYLESVGEDVNLWDLQIDGIDKDNDVVAIGLDHLRGVTPFFARPDRNGGIRPYALAVLKSLNRYSHKASVALRLYPDDALEPSLSELYSDADIVMANALFWYFPARAVSVTLARLDSLQKAWIGFNVFEHDEFPRMFHHEIVPIEGEAGYFYARPVPEPVSAVQSETSRVTASPAEDNETALALLRVETALFEPSITDSQYLDVRWESLLDQFGQLLDQAALRKASAEGPPGRLRSAP